MSFKDWLRKYSPPLSPSQIEQIAAKHKQVMEKAKEAIAPAPSKKRKK